VATKPGSNSEVIMRDMTIITPGGGGAAIKYAI